VNSERPFNKQWWPSGAFKLLWETARDEQEEATCRTLGLPEDASLVVSAENLLLDGGGLVGRVREWLAQQRRLFGRHEFTVADLRAVVKEAVHQGRLWARCDERRLAAMTIHQAKNREFDRVIVLWPYEVSGNDERKRRLAYNAITRARHEALVIVQGEDRAACSPFVPGVNPVSKASKPKKGRRVAETTGSATKTRERANATRKKRRAKTTSTGELG
jgi:hypothetical protein